MINEQFEYKEHVVTENVKVGETMVCDVCGKEIPHRTGYWRLTTHHNDWGNDSIDSYENMDICSPECLRKKFDEYIIESTEKGYEYNTKCFEAEHDRYFNKTMMKF